MQNILVVGGNGFIGSAVCKAALARGMRVTSLSSSGRPFRTPKGHSPAWTERVQWCAGDALRPHDYTRLLDGKTAVVHTLGVLFESGSSEGGYKQALRRSDPLAFAGAVISGVSSSIFGGGRNPLDEGGGEYERINRGSALTVCSTFTTSAPPETTQQQQGRRRSFIYLSAEDIFRPVVPSRYIETKRDAERGIAGMLSDKPDLRSVFVRPSLVYHSHFRPLTTPIATLLDLSATVHRSVPDDVPTPATILRAISSSSSASRKSSPDDNQADLTPGSLAPSPLSSIANALTVPPIHVDHVAEAIIHAIEDDSIEGVLDVHRMREVIGWVDKGRGVDRSGQSSGDKTVHERS
ncbi:NAD-binding protein [Fomitiporia mediterranea MF3/22]|uniref:NAD-binding protein n=1 Tax=Fomitiporia mediterranea (strain MF3/22) TaxID=694068 RepID=UPI0004408518|nr:NAD-binding protein [Fomitiporia mediterranea MF3/22]EJD02346.1 NAD-binding protein [Fomitiporia mediterranea MF3/22]